jgi:hypothetical protein
MTILALSMYQTAEIDANMMEHRKSNVLIKLKTKTKKYFFCSDVEKSIKL